MFVEKDYLKVTALQLKLCPTELYYFVMFTIQCNNSKQLSALLGVSDESLPS
jgi:hypothetical protein